MTTTESVHPRPASPVEPTPAGPTSAAGPANPIAPIAPTARRRGPLAVLRAVLRTTRPRQWPKNVLVLAAPLAYGGLGPRAHPVPVLLAAAVAFTCASAGVYLVNDAADAKRDRVHPRKRHRPVAAGELGRGAAVGLGVAAFVAAIGLALLVGDLVFTLLVTAFIVSSLAYSAGLKQVPVLEIAVVASGFLLRALGGAAASHIPPSWWFTAVCTFGALLVVTAKRTNERAVLGDWMAAQHRPALRAYSRRGLRGATLVLAVGMLGCYLAWALARHPQSWVGLEVLTVAPLAAVVVRFDLLALRPQPVRVEDLLLTDRLILALEALWLVLFVVATMVS